MLVDGRTSISRPVISRMLAYQDDLNALPERDQNLLLNLLCSYYILHAQIHGRSWQTWVLIPPGNYGGLIVTHELKSLEQAACPGFFITYSFPF